MAVLVGVGWSAIVTEGGVREVLEYGLFVGAVAALLYKLGKPFAKELQALVRLNNAR